MPSPILARADALMQRRHLATADSEEVPVLTDAIDIDDDIPVLVDVAPQPAPDPSATLVPAADPATPAERLDTAWGEALAEELGRRIEARLLAEIPRIVASTVSELLGEQEALGKRD